MALCRDMALPSEGPGQESETLAGFTPVTSHFRQEKSILSLRLARTVEIQPESDLKSEQIETALSAAEILRRDGLPNYFDDQRFGSVGADGEFIGKHMVRGDYEAALRQAMAAPYEFDRAEQRREKEVLRACWGRWAKCRDRLPHGHARSLGRPQPAAPGGL